MIFNVFTKFATTVTKDFRAFLSFQKETQYQLAVIHQIPVSQGNH